MASFSAGDTFLIYSWKVKKDHLTIVLCDPMGEPPKILTVSLTSRTRYTDPTLILDKGDHKFITHETAVSYDNLIEMEVSKLEELESMNEMKQDSYLTFQRHEPASKELLGRIIDGLFKSDDVSEDMRIVAREYLGMA